MRKKITFLLISMIIVSSLITGLEAKKKPKKKKKKYPIASTVPKFTFGNTLEEQEKQLKTNPLMLRFKESRKKMANDPYRPFYHYVNPESSLNDPNGLCFWKGNWHLFYQAYPPEHPRQHWGHAVSTDLIHWRDLPYAIYPDPERACFSGATLVEKDRVIAMYHGTRVGNMVALSSDPLLLNWKKVTGKAVIPIRNPDGSRGPYNVFDPCIWKKDGYYYSLSGGQKQIPGKKFVRANFLFKSKDLAKWEYMHTFVENDNYSLVGDDGACPYFWPIGNKHILIHFSHVSGGKYLLGDYDKKRDKFIVTKGNDFNFGPYGPSGVHAPSAAPDGKGGIIVIFNMNPGLNTKGWNQIMTLPRRLTLAPKGEIDELNMEPAGDIESLRYGRIHQENIAIPANKEIVLEKIKGNCMEISAEIDTQGAQMFEMNVLRSPNKEEFTRISFYKDKGYRHRELRGKTRDGKNYNKAYSSVISLDTSCSSILKDARSRMPETAQVYIKNDEPLKLRVFIDRSVVEVFVNGKQCIAARVYPGRKDSVGVSFHARGKGSMVRSIDAWKMKNIYEENK